MNPNLLNERENVTQTFLTVADRCWRHSHRDGSDSGERQDVAVGCFWPLPGSYWRFSRPHWISYSRNESHKNWLMFQITSSIFNKQWPVKCSPKIALYSFSKHCHTELFIINSTKTTRKQYLAFVMLFLAATSLAVRGSGSDVGMGEFWRNV